MVDRGNCLGIYIIEVERFPPKSGESVCQALENLLTPHVGGVDEGDREQSNVTAFPVAQRRHQIEIRRKFASLLSICRSQTMRDPTTDVAEPRPFHVPLIDTLGPVRCGVATVMSSSLRVPPHYQRRLEIRRLTVLSDIVSILSKLFTRSLHGLDALLVAIHVHAAVIELWKSPFTSISLLRFLRTNIS